ncbi:ATP-binding cassette domain-containing protein [Mucilaginibacter sp. UR6-1]|uniref:ATP-binding cassette domain-containing protein n=1 Tax=Mucilaginibacter sp. UR6-1 TaxID=1435643 RepID=UPI001E538E7A|nr:ATP-binding cassette domain-containing protein [Mucilaginibacter sp. UR6-1]MCC8407538.1 ATP-binding cassette domain-containing protein [Mucilaginibacter sp. UR6-1]
MDVSDTFLELNNVSVRGYNKLLFENLSLTVHKGEHWALVGQSGSGKSALLQTIAGKLNVTNGNIVYGFWEEYIQQHPDNSQITFHQLITLLESKHHFKNLSNTTDFYYQQRFNSSDSDDSSTVDEYIQDIHPLKGRELWNLDEVIALLNLQSLLHKKLIMLSNGETKRLRIASALIKNPALLLLDNPLAGLDVSTRQEFNTIIGKIAKAGTTVIMTAAPDEIPAAITNVAVLKDGNIIETSRREAFDASKYSFNPKSNIDGNAIAELTRQTETSPYRYIVNMRDVNIRYGENQVLKNVSWQIKPGEHWALLGPNGAGKSTLLSLINGDNPQAYANDIVLFDKKRGSGESIWDIKKRIGYVSPEFYQYFPADNSCLQVIESGYYDTLGLFRPSNSVYQQKALQWMKVLEIDQYARTLLKNIPASAQRLCLLARALVKNPPLLIFDEPCQGLDTHQQEHFKSVVEQICHNTPVTLIYVTHYQHEIPDSVDKVLRLQKGAVVS